ncbi:MAG: hypothetical protein KC912_16965 [Proteobacteria bacterium]|nr:hypothetical protein [Pseudomonadota bacterium]
MSTHLLIIDPQNDFVSPDGALSVPGADGDMNRLAAMIDRLSEKIDAVHVTLDTHQKMDISHPLWWADAEGNPPPPFTAISAEQMQTGEWSTRDPDAQERTLAYLRSLEQAERYPHVVWPEHCLVGTSGHAVWAPLNEAIGRWETRHLRRATYVWKGLSPWTEHFSAVHAEVVDPADARTHQDDAWVETLRQADTVLVAGEALSHCVANTVRDLVTAWGGEAERIVLVEDLASSVPGFDSLGAAFTAELATAGMALAKSREVTL